MEDSKRGRNKPGTRGTKLEKIKSLSKFYLSIITCNTYDLIPQIKKHRVAGWMNNKTNICCLQ